MCGQMLLDYAAIGGRIIQRRREMKLTQAELARRTGVTTSFIGQIERGEKVASLAMMARLSQALDASVDALVFGAAQRCEREECPLYGEMEALLRAYGFARRGE